MSSMTMVITTMVVCVVAVNSVIHLTRHEENVLAKAVIAATDPTRFGQPIATPTPSDSTPTESPTVETKSTTETPTITPTITPTPIPAPTTSTPTPTPTPIPFYKISGRVMDARQPLSGVTLMLGGTITASVTTNPSGSYAFSNLPAGGSYTVTPVRAKMNFTPPSRSLNNLKQDGSADFIGIAQAELYKISGRVTGGGQPLGGVRIRLDGTKTNSTTTNANGDYAFNDLPEGGNYTVTPLTLSLRMSFSPIRRAFNNLNHDESADFLGVDQTRSYKISGQVTDGRQPLGGVRVRLDGKRNDSATTDGSGNYAFRDLLEGGNYTIAPSATMSFRPSSRSFTNLSQNESANFTGVVVVADVLPPIQTCTDADRARERDNLINKYAAMWQRSIESEKGRVIAETIAARLPGVEPKFVEATASLGPVKYDVAFKECSPRLVMARYEWQVRMYYEGTTRTVAVPRQRTCGKLLGVWLCR